jgi:predicted dehydrogenase
MCLEAGKAVLCEKPFAVNHQQAEEMVRCARENELFCMEAMWTRFFPLMDQVRALLDEGAIGDPRMLQSDFGFRASWDPDGRLFDPELAGGSLLDVGVYCTALSYMVFGRPFDLTGFAHLGETGVDEQAAWVFTYEGGELASCASAVRTATPQEAVILGTDGRIRIHRPWWSPTRMTVESSGQEPEEMEFPLDGDGMNYEAAAVMHCLEQGKLEHPIMPLDETLQIARTMDELRAQWDLKYPFEK